MSKLLDIDCYFLYGLNNYYAYFVGLHLPGLRQRAITVLSFLNINKSALMTWLCAHLCDSKGHILVIVIDC